MRQGLRFLRAELPDLLATRTEALSPRMTRVIEDLAGDWRRLDERVMSKKSGRRLQKNEPHYPGFFVSHR